MTESPTASISSPSATTTQPILSVKNLRVGFQTDDGFVEAVAGVSFDVLPDEVLGIVGESGSGKSVTSLAVMRLVPDPPGKITEGEVRLRGGENLAEASYKRIRQVRGNEIAMIFQEPMTALNPVFRIGAQLIEAVRTHQRVSGKEARSRAIEMLSAVGIPDAEKRMMDYPHQFSGGMRQRVMIAMALICEPDVLIADEPTTALDVTTQAQVLELMLKMKGQGEGKSIILITHDLAVVAETCDRVIVMYGGMVQEVGPVEQIFNAPTHPYTKGLLASLPQLGNKKGRLYAIPGNVPSLTEMPSGCRFCTRCEAGREAGILSRCETEVPKLHTIGDAHQVRCHLAEPNAT